MRLKRWIIKHMEVIFRFIFLVLSKLPVKKNSIIFESFLGKQYSDNPKALFLYIKSNYPNYKLYWSIDNKYSRSFNDLDIIVRFSLKWFYTMARAEYWISNSRLPIWIPKPKHTKYIQTWHGTPLKRLGVDIPKVHMANTNTKAYKDSFIKEASKWDYLISPNSYSTEIFKQAFCFNKTMVESGYPRNDVLYNQNNTLNINRIKRSLNIPSNKKVILYAPTWRDNDYYSTGRYKFTLQLDLDKMKNKLADDFIVLLRMHYLVSEQFNLEPYNDFVYDFSNYSDISDLNLISDVLISDYSSVFFDYANLRRPILFYTYDLENYRDDLRGFYFNFEEHAPGPLLKSTDEIIDYLIEIRDGNYQLPSVFEEFYNEFCYLEDGNSSRRVVEEIFNIYK